MRKVVLWIGTSLDGFTSGVNEQLDWLVPHATQPESEAIFRRLRERATRCLVGRVNYEGFVGYWPQVKDDPKASRKDVDISRWLDEVPKVVFSRTLREVKWKNARLAKGSAAEEVAALKRAPGKDIIIQNSTRLAQSLLAAGWSTSFRWTVAPGGAGRRPRAVRRAAEAARSGPRPSRAASKTARFFVRYDVKRS